MIFDAVDKVPYGMRKDINDLLNKLYNVDNSNFTLTEEVEFNDHILIYEIDKKPVGCLFASNYEYINEKFYEKGCMHISNLFVLEEYRHQGIATALLQRIEEIAKDKGVETISSEYSLNNDKSANWHTKNGFIPIKTCVKVSKNI